MRFDATVGKSVTECCYGLSIFTRTTSTGPARANHVETTGAATSLVGYLTLIPFKRPAADPGVLRPVQYSSPRLSSVDIWTRNRRVPEGDPQTNIS